MARIYSCSSRRRRLVVGRRNSTSGLTNKYFSGSVHPSAQIFRPCSGGAQIFRLEAEKKLETMAYIHPFWNAADPALPPRTASGWGFASRISSHTYTAARWRTLGGWQALLTGRGGRLSSHMILDIVVISDEPLPSLGVLCSPALQRCTQPILLTVREQSASGHGAGSQACLLNKEWRPCGAQRGERLHPAWRPREAPALPLLAQAPLRR